MIGLPTIASSRISARLIPARLPSVASRPSSALRTASVSSTSPPSCIITYETRLIRSSPNRICGFMTPALARIEPSVRFTRWPGDGGRADVDRDAERPVVESGPDRDDVAAAVDRDRDAVAALRQGALERTDHGEVGAQAVQAPLRPERVEQPPEVAGRGGEIRFRDVHGVQSRRPGRA